MTYYESAKGLTITKDRALLELKKHCIDDIQGFLDDCRTMYKSFYSSCKTITGTMWYPRREYNYDGTPLTESQIATRDWAIARDAKRAA